MNADQSRAFLTLGIGPVWLTRPSAEQLAPPNDTSSPPQSAVASGPWRQLRDRVTACRACGLCEGRTQTVFGTGDQRASLMLIGEAPGADEDRLGEPFVGRAGALLDAMLAALGLQRHKGIYIANVIKCRPPGNRNPMPEEIARCEPFLHEQLALLQPRLVVLLGRFAAQSMLATEASIASLRGRIHSVQSQGRAVPAVVTYHPAYLLRNPADKAKSWVDLCLVRRQLEDLSAEPSDPTN
jgi:uracil-DNA glycosylase family 4